MEAFCKLIYGEIRSQSRVDIEETRAYPQRFEEVIACYPVSAIMTADVVRDSGRTR